MENHPSMDSNITRLIRSTVAHVILQLQSKQGTEGFWYIFKCQCENRTTYVAGNPYIQERSHYFVSNQNSRTKENVAILHCKNMLPDFHAQSTLVGISGHVASTYRVKVSGTSW